MSALLRLAPARLALLICAVPRIAHDMSAPLTLEPSRRTPYIIVLERSALLRLARRISAILRFARLRLAPDKSAPFRMAPCRSAPERFAPARLALVRSRRFFCTP